MDPFRAGSWAPKVVGLSALERSKPERHDEAMWKRPWNQPGVTAGPWTSQGSSSSLGPNREADRLAGLALQLEDLLDQVWRCEKDWRLDDRITLACRTLSLGGRARRARQL